MFDEVQFWASQLQAAAQVASAFREWQSCGIVLLEILPSTKPLASSHVGNVTESTSAIPINNDLPGSKHLETHAGPQIEHSTHGTLLEVFDGTSFGFSGYAYQSETTGPVNDSGPDIPLTDGADRLETRICRGSNSNAFVIKKGRLGLN